MAVPLRDWETGSPEPYWECLRVWCGGSRAGAGILQLTNFLPTVCISRDAANSPASGLSLPLSGLPSEEQHHEKPDLYQRLSSFQ